MSVPVSTIYVAALTVVGLALQFHAGRTRGRLRVSLGDGGNPTLLEAMRRQANFTESVPLALLLMVVIELNGASANTLHALGITLLVARIVHPFGISVKEMKLARGVGAVLTLAVMIASVVIALRQVLQHTGA